MYCNYPSFPSAGLSPRPSPSADFVGSNRDDSECRPSAEGILDSAPGFARAAASLYRRPNFRSDEWIPESAMIYWLRLTHQRLIKSWPRPRPNSRSPSQRSSCPKSPITVTRNFLNRGLLLHRILIRRLIPITKTRQRQQQTKLILTGSMPSKRSSSCAHPSMASSQRETPISGRTLPRVPAPSSFA